MIILGGIYTFENMIQVVIDIDDDIIITYQLSIKNKNTKNDIEKQMEKELINGINKSKIQIHYDQSFIDFYNGYLGKINSDLLYQFMMFQLWNMD